MTLVEFFDPQPMENAIASIILKPEATVFVCRRGDESSRAAAGIREYLRSLHGGVGCIFYTADSSSPDDICRALEAVVSENEDCVFHFTGGVGIIPLVAGMFCLEHRIRSFYTDIGGHAFINLYGLERLSGPFSPPVLSVKDVFTISGTAILRHSHFSGADYYPTLGRDMLRVWQIYKKRQPLWSKHVYWLQQASKYGDMMGGARPLYVYSPAYIDPQKGNPSFWEESVLRDLSDAGLVRGLTVNGQYVEFTYKNQTIMKCLADFGSWLELLAYCSAVETGFFDDVQINPIVDWDGDLKPEINTISELDVVMVKGVTPVFVSCKAGVPGALDLYEIELLAKKFGGSRAIPVLLTAADTRNLPFLSQRAKDMDVTLLDRRDIESGLGNRLIKLLADGK